MNNMAKQMDMFEEGGLMDEGGTVDPVSGNDVPPGSTQEEVRDDIPAQLSEGEFVFPADVVRYFGLEKLMEMRQEAKAGLARMEAMGQMGNADEATLPDDLPFTIDDLDMEDDGLEMAQGGIVQMANGGSVGTQVVVYGPDGTAYNNPAAAYPRKQDEKYGVEGYGTIGGGHKIAKFPTPVHGAAANFDLFADNYTGMTFESAMKKWRGRKSPVPSGYSSSDVISEDFLNDPDQAIDFFKKMALHESPDFRGMSDDDWRSAWDMWKANA